MNEVRTNAAVEPVNRAPAGGGDAFDRDAAGERRDVDAQHRDELSDGQDDAAQARDQDATDRDDRGDARDDAASIRDDAARRRDSLAEYRLLAAESRDREAGRRDERVAVLDGLGSDRKGLLPAQSAPHSEADLLSRLSDVQKSAAADRRFASLDRDAANDERWSARLDRDAACRDRNASSTERALAGNDRAGALVDRESGATGRDHARGDRVDGIADRGSAAEDRRGSSLDELTGAYTRGAGFIELTREMARSRRLTQSLTVAFIDVDQLKSTNDEYGHAAGDNVLRQVAAALRAGSRNYDLVVRYGGDEFFAVLPGMALSAATGRFEEVARALRSQPSPISISVGLAQMQPADVATEIVERADVAMYLTRGRRRR